MGCFKGVHHGQEDQEPPTHPPATVEGRSQAMVFPWWGVQVRVAASPREVAAGAGSLVSAPS